MVRLKLWGFLGAGVIALASFGWWLWTDRAAKIEELRQSQSDLEAARFSGKVIALQAAHERALRDDEQSQIGLINDEPIDKDGVDIIFDAIDRLPEAPSRS